MTLISDLTTDTLLAQGISESNFARLITGLIQPDHVSRQAVHQWSTGETVPKITTLLYLSTASHVPVWVQNWALGMLEVMDGARAGATSADSAHD